MRHSTWTAIESYPAALWLYRSYRKLPDGIRAPARWLLMPRWYFAVGRVRMAAKNTVRSGPFAGTRLNLAPLSNRHLLSYLLGTYEMELWDVIERIASAGYSTVINIGAGDGYYLMGLARRLPTARMVGFEMLAENRRLLQEAAAANGVADRVRLDGYCTTGDLQRALAGAAGRRLIVCDIEGNEAYLLDPSRIGDLRTVDMLIETHDDFCHNCTGILIDRFSCSHRVERILARPRTLADFPRHVHPLLGVFMPKTAVELINERRSGAQQWLFLTALR